MPDLIRGCLGVLTSAFASARRTGHAEERTRLLSTNAVAEMEGKSGKNPRPCIDVPHTDNGTAAQLNQVGDTRCTKPGKVFKVKSARSETAIGWSRAGGQWLHVDACGLTLVDAKGEDQPVLWSYQCMSLYGYSRDSFSLIVTSCSSSPALSHFTLKTAPGVGRAIFLCVQKELELSNRVLREQVLERAHTSGASSRRHGGHTRKASFAVCKASRMCS